MELNVFLLLPQDVEFITDESSFEQVIKEICELLESVPKDKNTKIFYDGGNIKKFVDICTQWDEKYLKVNYKVGNFLGKDSINIRDKKHTLRDDSCVYVLWNYDKLTAKNSFEILAEIVERKFKYSDLEKNFLLLNITNHVEACRDVLLVFKDAKHHHDLPNFARIPFVSNKMEFELWLKTNHITEFILDKNKFTKNATLSKNQNTTVYQEKETLRYWYLDTLHKDHYEVFDKTGNHLGEASLNGELDESKKDKEKKLNIS